MACRKRNWHSRLSGNGRWFVRQSSFSAFAWRSFSRRQLRGEKKEIGRRNEKGERRRGRVRMVNEGGWEEREVHLLRVALLSFYLSCSFVSWSFLYPLECTNAQDDEDEDEDDDEDDDDEDDDDDDDEDDEGGGGGG
uniref:Uncharacterized protein n=1 Tax=Vespula pensylvanica TaxID=30213 RepID=A0A834NE51_VESPE|nr:hypothetical protein H0235_014426 [Vespula pensylvanica]